MIFVDLKHQASAPADPAVGHSAVWVDASGHFHIKSNVGGTMLNATVNVS